MQHPISPTLRDCINRPFPSSTCFLDNSLHTFSHTHIQNYFWRISFQSSSVSIETFNEGEANKTAALPWLSTAPRNNRYHYHSARRRTIWTGSHGQLRGRGRGGAWYRQLKFMRKSLTFVHGRRIEGDVTPTARFIMGDEGNSFFVFLIRIREQWYFKGEDILKERIF